MALESMRRYLTPMEEEEVEGGISEPTGPLAALGRASDMARIANMGPRPLEEADVSKPMPSEAVPVSESEMTAVRAAYARRGQNLPPHLRPKDIDQPIPVASAPGKADVPGALKGAIPATTATRPAPPADGSGGDDDVRNLYLARLAAQSAAGFGGMGAGKNIDMGIADTLGERMKQIEALRAKRQERSMELAREDEQSSALVQQYKSLAAQGLVPELPLLDKIPIKQAAGLIKTYGSLPGMAAKAAEITALTPVKVAGGLATAEGKQAQTKSRTYTDALTQARTDNEIARQGVIAAQAEALRAKAELDNAKAAGAPEGDSKLVNARQKLVDAYQKQYLAPAESLAAVEAKAPGLTRGQPPEWLTGRELELVRNNATYELASDETKDVFAAAQKYLDGYRNQQYGSALTATEQAELERLVKADIFTGADKLSRFFDLIRKDIANNFQSKLKGDRLVQQSFVDKYVGAEEGPLAKFVGPQGLFSDVWTLQKAPATPSAAGAPVQAGGVERVIMLNPQGERRAVRADQVEKAMGQGWRMP
jgi:outer membrane murein-binding lipoprotein Lpp